MFKRGAVAVSAAILLGVVVVASGASASEARNFSTEQQEAFKRFGLSSSQIDDIIIDSAMTRDEAIGSDSIVSPEALNNHQLIKPYLVVIPLVYHGYDNKVHVGQMVVHQYMVSKVVSLFLTMWKTDFSVQSVIPGSKFGYNDEFSMQQNNSSAYRPELGSEHGKGSAIDINPLINPFDTSAYNGNPVDPPGAHYDPTAKGALVLQGPVQKKAAELHLEWGGNWGNPNAVPSTDFFRAGYFDYQHFQLGYQEYDIFEAQLPPGFVN